MNENFIQAILFKKNVPLGQGLKIMNQMNLTPIKPPHKTKNYFRYGITQPDYNKYYYGISGHG